MWRTAAVVAVLAGCGARWDTVEPTRFRCHDVELATLAPVDLVVAPPGELIAVMSIRETPWGRFDDRGRPPVIETAEAADEYVLSTAQGQVGARDRWRAVTRRDNRFGLEAPVHLAAVTLVDDPAWALPQLDRVRVIELATLSRSMVDARRRWDGMQMTLMRTARARIAELEVAMPGLAVNLGVKRGRPASGFTATWNAETQRLLVRWRWWHTLRRVVVSEVASVAATATVIAMVPPMRTQTTDVEVKLGFGLDLQYDRDGRLRESRWLEARPDVHTTSFFRADDSWLPPGTPQCARE